MTVDLIFATILLGFLPFLIMGMTCYTKFAVVLAFLRNAIGANQIPPNIVMYSMAAVMSIYVMLPVGIQSAAVIEDAINKKQTVFSRANDVAKPFLDFMEKHTEPSEIEFFEGTAKRIWGEKTAENLIGPKATNVSKLLVIAPAFMVSELTKAFQIGFLLFLPFVIIDLIVSNVLLALGMQTLSPVTVSLPIKLLLFIGLDGWHRILEALSLSYI